jgi:biopolymer transport protein ExbD
VEILRKLAGIPGFGLSYSSVLILVTIPAALFYIALFGYGHKGLEVRITVAPPSGSRPQGCLVISVLRPGEGATTNDPEVRLNSKPVSWMYLRQSLEQKLNRRTGWTVLVEGDRSLEVADVVRVIDTARGVQPGIAVVLLTPTLKKTLSNECVNTEP